MIVPPEGWRRVASVGSDVFTSPDRATTVRYRMRNSPLRRAQQVIDAALAEVPQWSTRTLHPRERIMTHESEYAIGAAVEGGWLDSPATRFICAIYGDDFYDLFDAISIGAESVVARARALVHSATLRLGVRRRRYFYERPAGWHGHPTGLTTHWFPPQFPAHPKTIVVYPANPTNERPHAIHDAMIAHHESDGAQIRELEPPRPLSARSRLEGVHWRFALLTGRSSVARDLVVFARAPYTYALQLDSMHEVDYDACTMFLALAATVEPVAAVGALPGSQTDVFSHYV
jgi:hypothetical protein